MTKRLAVDLAWTAATNLPRWDRFPRMDVKTTSGATVRLDHAVSNIDTWCAWDRDGNSGWITFPEAP